MQNIGSENKIDKKLRIFEVTKILDETPTIKTFFFKQNLVAIPGQFIMVWVPGVDEIPMSVSYSGDTPGITVANVGKTTKYLHGIPLGTNLGLRGPYGKGFDISGSNNILAVAGGCGSAPIGPALDLAKDLDKKITFLIGARTKSELLFKDRALNLGIPVEVTTDDGSEGFSGFVTQRLIQLLDVSKFDLIITCGPEVMLKSVVELAKKNRIPVQASLERYMKCGIGVCDACAINGYQVCRDGPVFTDNVLDKLTEFGKIHRDVCGRSIKI
jgi:dihydroorotate dehydrogenase electron transfer subunit